MKQLCLAKHQIFKETCKHCQALKKEWYQTLSKTGFTDIEKGETLRTTVHSHSIRRDLQTEIQFQARQAYYLWASRKAADAKFQSSVDKTIWAHHAEGKTLREIEPEVGLDYSYISRKLKRIENYIKDQAGMIIGSITYHQAVY